MAAEFVRNGIAYFPFNNRGAHVMKRLRRSGIIRRNVKGGMAYERIRDCVPDIDGAIAALRKRGYSEFTLIGHSTGANKIAVYDHYRRRNRVKRYVFLAGGDDVGLMYAELGRRGFRKALDRARESGGSDELVAPSISSTPMSWKSFLDMADPDGDYNVFPFLEVMRDIRLSKKPRFRYMRGISKPSLVVYGDRDEYCFGDVSRCVSILAEALIRRPRFEFVIMKDADHGFGRREEDLAALIVRWLRRDD